MLSFLLLFLKKLVGIFDSLSYIINLILFQKTLYAKLNTHYMQSLSFHIDKHNYDSLLGLLKGKGLYNYGPVPPSVHNS